MTLGIIMEVIYMHIQLLNNYSNEEIEKLYKNPNYLREKSSKIFEEAKSWTNNIFEEI